MELFEKTMDYNNVENAVTMIFEEAERLDCEIRYTRDPDNKIKQLSVIDVVAVLTSCNKDDAGKRVRELPNEARKNIPSFKFPGRGQQNTYVATPSQLIGILLALPNPNNRYPLLTKLREFCCKTTVRSMGGDINLANEIEARNNAFESGAVPQDHMLQAFRTEATTSITNIELDRRRKLENDKLEREIRQMDINLCKQGLEILKGFDPIDERAAVEKSDKIYEIQRILVNTLGQAIKPIEFSQSMHREVTFESVAKSSGLSITPTQIQKKRSIIGRLVAAKYRQVNDREPVKHQTILGGKCITVNTYYEKDAPIIEEVLKEEFGLE